MSGDVHVRFRERLGGRFPEATRRNLSVSSRKAGEHLLSDINAFLNDRLKLKVNEKKSAVARPWERKFLGYSVTRHKQSRLKIAISSVNRLKEKIRSLTMGNMSKSVSTAINELILRGWISYFRYTEVKGVLEELDSWFNRKLRCLLWRQWKRPYTRAKILMRAGLKEKRAWRSVCNQRGAWWNAGANHISGDKDLTVQKAWLNITVGTATANMSRRIRNRTYGDVRGRRE
ncbi:putative Reverse transcriptase (partial) [Xenorhabdus nematophila F1]|uniref:Reverse transcriptase (Partial) n=2 Tax=Xenorhabdus nematophila TaxID=628 RepID=D3VHQ6_XENNA|nr:group II intron maturase-specific domain-containing protein [Xenorhabdus nematophila]CBJ88395.1 putative Reverse transcriptase (partial) [Xenorhabdus nematophila ATCC 19061]CCW30273.1 putative Reverse transcriptase (partial) [Xenorhabdus nematophila F1]CEK21312.1 putative Reverse transcriptase (partial) [Xenorhabdus nematophila AN6/1]